MMASLATITADRTNIACKVAIFPEGIRASAQMVSEQIRAPGVDGELQQQVHRQFTEFEAQFQTSETSQQGAMRTQALFESLKSSYIDLTWLHGTGTRALRDVFVIQSMATFRATRSAGAGVSAGETHTVYATLTLRCTQPEESQ